MNLSKIKILILIQLLAFSAFAQRSTTFPLNEEVKTGKLANGMTYYILHNEEPKDRASFYFVQNVGAILEEDSQNGLAHFLEHMAFNGTEHFEGKGILNFLEKHGVRFGADINAYTAQDQTVYNLSSVPTDKEGLLDSCLLVLHDWSGYLLLKEDEIDAERGVIKEEWRTRRNSRFRINAQTSKVLFKDSKYAVRDVIGDLEVIKNFEYEALRDYYKKWYRPDLQAVVVVGDVDVDEMEAKIKEKFSTIPLNENLPEREYYSIPDNDELLYCQATDIEARSTAVALLYKSANPTVRNENTFRTEIMEKMYQTMIGSRFKEVTQDKNSSSFGLFAGFFSFTRTTKVFYLNASPKEGKGAESFKEMMTEIERVRLYGFTQVELDRTKLQLLSGYENTYQNRDKITNDNWARQLGNHFLEAEPVFTAETEYKLSTKMVNSITLAELNAWCKTVQPENNQVLLVTGPDKEKDILPSEESLVKVLTEVKNTKIEAYVEEADETPLVSAELKGSKVTGKFDVKGIDAKTYILGNGAKVVLMPTEYSKDEIKFQAYSYGGKSLLNADELASAEAATSMASAAGIGEFDVVKLQKKLAGKTVKINPFISNLTEGIRGSSNMKDFETLLQLTYLTFEAPRFDEEIFNITLDHWNTYAQNRAANNAEAFRDSTTMINSNYNSRTVLFNPEMIKGVDYDKVQNVYKSRFHAANDFTFVFVGNLDEKTALPLIEKYIGSIKGNGAVEKFADHNVGPAKGNSKLHFDKKMEIPKATVYANLSGELKYSLLNKLCVKAVEQLLSKRYLATVREEEGGSYGVGVRAVLNRVPKNEFSLFLKFDCDPVKQEKLLEIVWKEIYDLKDGKVVSKDLNEIKQNLIKMRKEDVVQNKFWMEAIVTSLKTDKEFVNDEEFEKIVNSINEKMIAKVAKKMFKKMNTTEVIMRPAE